MELFIITVCNTNPREQGDDIGIDARLVLGKFIKSPIVKKLESYPKSVTILQALFFDIILVKNLSLVLIAVFFL